MLYLANKSVAILIQNIDSLKVSINSLKKKDEILFKNFDSISNNLQNFKDDIWKHDVYIALISAVLATILSYWFSHLLEKWKNKEKRKTSIYKIQELFQQTILQLTELIRSSTINKLPNLSEYSHHLSYLNKFISNSDNHKQNFYNSIYIFYNEMNEILTISPLDLEKLDIYRRTLMQTDKILDVLGDFLYSRHYGKQILKQVLNKIGIKNTFKLIRIFNREYALYSFRNEIFFELISASHNASLKDYNEILKKYKL